MTDLDSAGLSAAEKALELLHHREPHPLRSSAVREVVRAYLAALSVPSDTEKPRPSPDDYREAVVALADSPEQRTAFLRLIDDVFAAGRAAASPDPPAAADLVAAHLRERWPCTCRPGMDGGGVYHAADCNSRREGSQAVLAVIRLLRAAAPPASPDERLREAATAIEGLLRNIATPDQPSVASESDRLTDVAFARRVLARLAAADRETPDEET